MKLDLSKCSFSGKNIEQYAKNLYLTDEYIKKNPTLHEEDSSWKVSKILPLIDKLANYLDKDEINLLDVGGGAGLILNAISTYIERSYSIKVNKFALDLSPRMLEIQKKRNPDLKKSLNEDIRKTSLANKEIDVTLLIDLLEHVVNPIESLNEVRRISNFAIFKVPLEDNLMRAPLLNLITGVKTRKVLIETIGHINVYNFSKLIHQLEKNTGHILDFYFMNYSNYFLTAEYYKHKLSLKDKLAYSLATYVFRLSPKLCSFIFDDSVMILAKCYPA